MLRTITPLNPTLFIHYSNDQYYLNIIHSKKPIFRIASEQKISYFAVLNTLQRSYMEKNTTVVYYYVIIVDITLGWALYCIKSLETQEPVEIYKGKFLSEKQEIKRLVSIHQIDDKILLVFEKFTLFYLHLPKDLKKGVYPTIKEFIPYGQDPKYLHQPFSVNKGFLPQQQELQISFTYYCNVSELKGLLFVVVQSKTNQLNSIYALDYDRKKAYLMSGSSIFLNIQHKILNILPTNTDQTFLMEAQGKLLKWSLNLQGKGAQFQSFQYKLSLLNRYSNKGQLNYIALQQNQPVIIAIQPKQGKVKKLSSPLKIPSQLSCVQIYASQKSEEFYVLTKKGEFYCVNRDGFTKVIQNSFTSIVKAQLNISSTHNFLIVYKLIGNETGKVLVGNHLFTYMTNHYSHGMLLNCSNLIFYGADSDMCFAYLSSPLIGTLKLNISRKKQNNAKQSTKKQNKEQNQLFELSIDKNSKINTAQQSYFLNQTYQIVEEQIIEMGNKPAKISKLFQNTIQFIEKGLVLSNELIVLSASQQIHVFSSKMSRKYIYCFNHPIKNIYSLNDINVIGVELYEPGEKTNQLHVLILQPEKASKLKSIPIPDVFKHIQLSTVINTSDYKLNLFGKQLVICSHDSLHKYQIQKIIVQNYQLPLPQSSFSRLEIVPLLNFSKDKNNSQFLMIFREEQLQLEESFEKVEVFFCAFLQKYLLKKLQLRDIHLSFEKVMTLTQLPKDKPILATYYGVNEGINKAALSFRYLLLIGQRYASVFCMKYGKIQLQWLQNRSYLEKELQKIETIPEKIIKAGESLTIQKPITYLKTKKNDYYLIFNQREIYYANFQGSKISTISYYSLINDEFVTFRNNLHINELNDEEFMSIFSQKMLIKDIKYLNDSIIFVLYEYCIIVLQIGFNNSLVVKQQIKFRNPQNTEIVKIQQFLQNYDEQSIYLRQSHGRIYLLKKVQKCYQIIFHSYMDEDVILFTRVSSWFNRDRSFKIQAQAEQKAYQELVLKKDGQLLIKSEQAKQEDNKMQYI